MMPKWTSRPVIKPGDIIGKPAGWTPESDLDHFVVCPGCGALIDMRDLGWHFSMLASCPTLMTRRGALPGCRSTKPHDTVGARARRPRPSL